MGNGSLDSQPEVLGSRPLATTLEHHSETDVYAAMEALSNDDIRYLVAFARWRILGARGKADEADENDLFSLAITQTLKLKRKWKLGITLRNHIISCMRSIADRRFKKAAGNIELAPEHPGPPFVPEAVLDARTNVNRLHQELADDGLALQVLETMNDGLSPRKAQKLLNMPAKVYQAARKRIRRRAESLFGLSRGKRYA